MFSVQFNMISSILILRLCQQLHLLQRQTQIQKRRKHSNLQIQNDQNHQIKLGQLDNHFEFGEPVDQTFLPAAAAARTYTDPKA